MNIAFGTPWLLTFCVGVYGRHRYGHTIWRRLRCRRAPLHLQRCLLIWRLHARTQSIGDLTATSRCWTDTRVTPTSTDGRRCGCRNAFTHRDTHTHTHARLFWSTHSSVWIYLCHICNRMEAVCCRSHRNHRNPRAHIDLFMQFTLLYTAHQHTKIIAHS